MSGPMLVTRPITRRFGATIVVLTGWIGRALPRWALGTALGTAQNPERW